MKIDASTKTLTDSPNFPIGFLVCIVVPAWWLITSQTLFAGEPGSMRKALVVGRGEPFRDRGGIPTHPQMAKVTFLRLMDNPDNDPKKGWTADLSWDLMQSLGMNPTNTPLDVLLNYIGSHHLGYRILINNSMHGQASPGLGAALDNGMMPFAPQGNNQPNFRYADPPGLRSAISVAGGTTINTTSYGPAVEFIDALPLRLSHANFEDAAQSWANQVVAAKLARILDTHPSYNIFDARQHLRQAGSNWRSGWNETNGYGRVDANASVGKLLPGPPLELIAVLSHDHHQVEFTWHNFLQTGFAGTVSPAKMEEFFTTERDNFTWTSDVDGEEAFTYWSKNNTGEKSRIESYQVRKIDGLTAHSMPACLVLGAPKGDEPVTQQLNERFHQLVPNWNCDIVYRAGNPQYDTLTSFPVGVVMGILPDFASMVSYSISNHYRVLIVPSTYAESDLYRYRSEWDRATAAGLLVIIPHHPSTSTSRKPEARRLIPPRLFSAISVGAGTNRNVCSFGPGLEFFDAPATLSPSVPLSQIEAVPVIASKLAKIIEANPNYNNWDARQHLRQSSSLYTSGWIEDGGYGRPPEIPTRIASLDPAPPLDIQAVKSSDSKSVTFTWQNFIQTSFASTVIQREDGRIIHEGSDTRYNWSSDSSGEATFRFFSKDKSGRLSRGETYTVVKVEGLIRN